MAASPTWKNLDGTQFERLCVELLRRMGFADIVHRGGSGDRGLDITANCMIKDPLGRRVERWAFQCRNWPDRALSRDDLGINNPWLGIESPDVYCVITTGRVSQPTREFVVAHGVKSNDRFRLSVVDGQDLEDLMNMHSMQDRLGSVADVAVATDFVAAAMAAWEGEPVAVPVQLGRVIEGYRDRLAGRFDLSTAYRTQHHEVVYLGNGTTRSTYRFEVLNLSRERIAYDVMTLYGDLGTSADDLDARACRIDDHSSRPMHCSVQFDKHDWKVLHVGFGDEGLPAGESLAYEVAVTWPCRQPLEGMRRYSMPVWRLTRSLSFEVRVPSEVRPVAAQLELESEGSVVRMLSDVKPREVDGGFVLEGGIDQPPLGAQPTLRFTLVQP